MLLLSTDKGPQMLPDYDAYKFMPLVGSWEKHTVKQGNRDCLFQGCSTV